MLIFRLLLIAFIASLSGNAEAICIAGIGDCGPKNYDECILENIKGVESDAVLGRIMKACRNQFPLSKLIKDVDYSIWWKHNKKNDAVEVWITNKSRKKIDYVEIFGYAECGNKLVPRPEDTGTGRNHIEGRDVLVGGSLMINSLKPAQDFLTGFSSPDHCLLANVYWGEYD